MTDIEIDPLTALRRELAALVATGTGNPAEAFLPGRLTPPVSIVTPSTPYLVAGNTFGTFLVRLQVLVVLRTKANEVITTELDEAITASTVAAVNGGFGVEQIGQPFALESGGATYFAAEITTTKTIHL